MAAAQTSARLLAGRPVAEAWPWLRILLGVRPRVRGGVHARLSLYARRMTDPPPAGRAHRATRARPRQLIVAAALAVAAMYVRVIWFTPVEATQGLAQKILYLHAPAAFVSAVPRLRADGHHLHPVPLARDEKLDRVAESVAEVGLVFTTVVLVTGPLWGKPIWGAWWTWDARLTLDPLPLVPHPGYCMLRGAVDGAATCARATRRCSASSAALLVPFIHLSVYLFRTLHPMPIVLKPERPSMPPRDADHVPARLPRLHAAVRRAAARTRYRHRDAAAT